MPPPPGYCLAMLSHYLENSTTVVDSECDALELAYEEVCTKLPPDVLPKDLPKDMPDPWPIPDTVQCCLVISETWSERCDVDANGQLSDQRLLLSVVTIALCLFVKEVITNKKITFVPGAAGCILVGLCLGFIAQFTPTYSDFKFDEKLFLRVLLPPICLDAAMQINKKAFRSHIGPILTLACVGTVVATLISGGMMKYMSTWAQLRDLKGNLMGDDGGLPWAESLCFGALISAVDPIAVLAVMNSLGVPDTSTLYILVFGESMLNDGVAVVIFNTVTAFMKDDVAITSGDILWAVLDFLTVFVGSSAVGLAVGVVTALYFRCMNKSMSPLSEVITFFMAALMPYYICDGWGWSGITAILIAGVTMDVYALRHLSDHAKLHVHFVIETFSNLTESAIFAYLGVFMFTANYKWNTALVCVSVVAMLVSRGIMIVACSFVVNRMDCCKCAWRLLRDRTRDPQDSSSAAGDTVPESPSESPPPGSSSFITPKTQFILWFAGMRGGISFALVNNIPVFDLITKTGSRFKPELEACTSTCIMISMFFFGGLTNSVLAYLGITGNAAHGEPSGDSSGFGLLDVLLRRTSLTTGMSLTSMQDSISETGQGADVSLLDGTLLSDEGSLNNDHFNAEKR
jgi:NhaP-type Na+/H+ or K+/H+ antiporter